MQPAARFFGALLAALTGLLLIVSATSIGPRAPKKTFVWVARKSGSSICSGPSFTVHVLAGKLEINGSTMTQSQVRDYLAGGMRNQTDRLVYVEGDPAAAAAEVTRAIEMLRKLKVEVALLTPAVRRSLCYQSPVPVAARNSGNEVQPVPWWRIW